MPAIVLSLLAIFGASVIMKSFIAGVFVVIPLAVIDNIEVFKKLLG